MTILKNWDEIALSLFFQVGLSSCDPQLNSSPHAERVAKKLEALERWSDDWHAAFHAGLTIIKDDDARNTQSFILLDYYLILLRYYFLPLSPLAPESRAMLADTVIREKLPPHITDRGFFLQFLTAEGERVDWKFLQKTGDFELLSHKMPLRLVDALLWASEFDQAQEIVKRIILENLADINAINTMYDRWSERQVSADFLRFVFELTTRTSRPLYLT